MAKREKKPEAPESDRTIVLFTSLSMILLAFFIMLSAMSTSDSRRQRLALGSLIGGFGVLPKGMGPDPDGKQLDVGSPMESGNDREAIFREFFKSIRQQGILRGISAEKTDAGTFFKIEENLLFAPGSSELSPASFMLMDKLSSVIMRINVPVTVTGHTDVSGSEINNYKLSLERSVSIYRYFTEVTQMPERLLTLEAYGARHLANPKKPKSAINRRVEIRFY